MKVLALHLPQYHEIPENDEWWGKGFTEWTNVRNARPIYKGHRQPQLPYGQKFYDLTDPRALIWQAGLAQQYGVDGFVFFHYWSNGKRLLERPVELWRETPRANLGYALCWANHPWSRTWDGKEHQVLWPQTYGGVEDWDEHLDALIPHFVDERYLYENGRPLLFLYNAGDIPNVNEMVMHWQKRIQHELGLPGLYLVEYISAKNPGPACRYSSAVYEDEPVYSLRFEIPASAKALRFAAKRLQLPDYQSYDETWRRILAKRRRYPGRAIVQGAFVAWDNSPRRGSRGPTIIRGSTPEGFERNLGDLLRLRREGASDSLLVINAWNEWGEGAVLEPSEQDGLAYLEALKAAREAKARRDREA